MSEKKECLNCENLKYDGSESEIFYAVCDKGHFKVELPFPNSKEDFYEKEKEILKGKDKNCNDFLPYNVNLNNGIDENHIEKLAEHSKI